MTVEYYISGALISVTNGYGTASAATTDYQVDPDSLSTTETIDPNGNFTTYTYDSDGNVLTKTDALGNTWTYTYNSFDEVLTSQTPNQAADSVETTNTYDGNGNLESTSTPKPGGGYVTTDYTYGDGSEPGDVTAVEDPNGKTTHLAYDTYGDLTATVDPLGRITTYRYNILGEKTSSVSPRGSETTGSGPADIPGDVYHIAGPGPQPYIGDGGPAASAYLNNDEGVAVDSSGDIYVADNNNNRIQEIAASTGTQWGISMTAGDVYTVVGSETGNSGNSGDGAVATSALLDNPARSLLIPRAISI